MQTIPASIILEDVYRLMGWDPALTVLDPQEVAMARNALSQALQEMWERWWWEQLMQCEQLQLAATFNYDWSSTATYKTGRVVYFAATDSYYIALRPAGPPALLPGQSYSTFGFDDGLPDTAVPVTTITDNFYGWFRYRGCDVTGHTTLWNPDMNPSLGDLCYWQGNNFQWTRNQGDLPNDQPNPALIWDPATQIPTAGWVLVPPFFPTIPATIITPVPSHTPFLPGVERTSVQGPAGELHSVSRSDPRTTVNAERYRTREADDMGGRVILGLDMGLPWVLARRVTPILTGDPYAATQAYDATPAQDLVFDS